MRLLMFLVLYAIAFLFGFVGRGRFDTWMYLKPHMQQRIRVFAAEVEGDPDPVGVNDFLPPSTTDNYAFSPRQTEALLRSYDTDPVAQDPPPDEGGDLDLEQDEGEDFDEAESGGIDRRAGRPIEPA